MKKNNLIIALLLISFINSYSQEFEATNFPDISSTPSASRSVNFVDINGDGWDDIFVTNGLATGQNNMLYMNDTNGGFITITSDIIVNDNERSDGASFADVDNDGDLDAIMVTFGAGGVGRLNYFYRNNGDGSFTHEPNIAMGTVLTYSETATWVDVNNDQFLDLYVTNSVGNLANLYYENQGDGSFLNITNLPITNESKPSRSVDWIDYDADGDFDLFVTNETSSSSNSLFRNDGPNNFTQITDIAIVQDYKVSAGSSWGDIDNDGDFDLFVANWNGFSNQLFINDGGIFTEDNTSIIADPTTFSFGSTFGDIDNDGDLDLFVCNAYEAGQTLNYVYINDGAGNFTQDTSSALANQIGYTFGAAFGDYDNDGWLDIFLANTLNENQTNSLYHNIGTGNNWIKIKSQGTESNSSAVGAIVKVKANINGVDVWQQRKISANSGYCSQNSFTNHFGLGDAVTIEEIEVSWPSGLIENFNNIEINNSYKIIEGAGIFLGFEDLINNNLLIYPNPFSDELNISSKIELNKNDITISIYSLEGQLVLESSAKKINKINTKSLSTGNYIYQLKEGSVILKKGQIIKK